jgi:hypothetical protein
MNIYQLLLIIFPWSALAFLHADEQYEPGYATEKEAEERDMEALQEYINTKRAIAVKDKSGNLMISGDIRGEWYYIHSKVHHSQQRGWSSRHLFPNSAINKETPPLSHKKYKNLSFKKRVAYRTNRDELLAPYATSEFDIEANLILDYIGDKGWASIQLQMSNPAGLVVPDREPLISDNRRIMYGSGIVNDIALRKCCGGYNIWENGASRFDIEVGRRRLYDVFDSKIEFDSYFDGILARWARPIANIANITMTVAAFVVDSSVNHYGYVGEVGLQNLAGSGFDLKYSLIDWDTLHRSNRFGRHHALGTRFINSQALINYTFIPSIIGLSTNLYAAYLVNHAAHATGWTGHSKANNAYYVGGAIGEAVHKGDYAIELLYQWIQAQAVPEGDLSTLSRDNPRGISFYNRRSGGQGNIKGWQLDGLYALTDNWTLNAHVNRIQELNRHIGGRYRSWELYVGAIFTF